MRIVFKAKLSRMGDKLHIYVPKAFHTMMKDKIGREVVVIIEEAESGIYQIERYGWCNIQVV